jgi:HAE1 family hydrophobic/amphiphilic exporter-1
MSKFFINRPIVAMVISILMVILGLVALSGLPIALFPNIADPQIQINATYSGADAITMQQSVATRALEEQLACTPLPDCTAEVSARQGRSSRA